VPVLQSEDEQAPPPHIDITTSNRQKNKKLRCCNVCSGIMTSVIT